MRMIKPYFKLIEGMVGITDDDERCSTAKNRSQSVAGVLCPDAGEEREPRGRATVAGSAGSFRCTPAAPRDAGRRIVRARRSQFATDAEGAVYRAGDRGGSFRHRACPSAAGRL